MQEWPNTIAADMELLVDKVSAANEKAVSDLTIASGWRCQASAQ